MNKDMSGGISLSIYFPVDVSESDLTSMAPSIPIGTRRVLTRRVAYSKSCQDRNISVNALPAILFQILKDHSARSSLPSR